MTLKNSVTLGDTAILGNSSNADRDPELIAHLDSQEASVSEDAGNPPTHEALHKNDAMVIELHAFLERRSEIEHKIHVLEQMPVIDVFVGADALRQSSAPTVGLPSRQQYEEWVKVLETIEAETDAENERFDGLKEFAKAKSEQDLSPEDTHLIDITLSTLLALDKLLGLLRKRSELLDLLDLRLQWEEQRLLAWSTHSKILADLRTFIVHAVWTPATYSTVVAPESKTMEDNSFLHILSPEARDRRSKFSDSIATEARALVSHLVIFRRDSLPLSGTILDKMIGNSTVKVPDFLLDEQDKLEDESRIFDGLAEKFIPGLLFQWRKADEFFAELKKHQSTAHSILNEIQTAQQSPPSSSLALSLTTRCDTLASRLHSIGHPSTTIPRPRHPLHNDHNTANDLIHSTLSNELTGALKLLRRVQMLVKEYASFVHVTERAIKVCADANGLSDVLDRLSTRIREGSSVKDGDGSAPRLDTVDCLEPTRHALYIALYPSLLEETTAAEADAQRVFRHIQATLLELRAFPTLFSLVEESSLARDRLERCMSEVERDRSFSEQTLQTLREAREVWTATQKFTATAIDTHETIMEAIATAKWKSQALPASPISTSPSLSSGVESLDPATIRANLDHLQRTLSSTVITPLGALIPLLHVEVRQALDAASSEATAQIKALYDLTSHWERIRNQSSAMQGVMVEVSRLESALVDIRESIPQAAHDPSSSMVTSSDEDLSTKVEDIRAEVRRFIENLPSVVPFVSSQIDSDVPSSSSPTAGTSVSTIRRLRSSTTLSDRALPRHHPTADALRHMMSALDHIVRADVNAWTMSLSSGISALENRLNLLALSRLGLEMDRQLESIRQLLDAATKALQEETRSCEVLFQRLAEDLSSEFDTEGPELFSQLLEKLDAKSAEHIGSISLPLESTQETMRQMRSNSIAHDIGPHNDLLVQQARSLEEVEPRIQKFQLDVAGLRARLLDGQRQAAQRAHDRILLSERQEMKRKGSLDKAELEASLRALRESEEKARVAAEEYQRWQSKLQASLDITEDIFKDSAGSLHMNNHPIHAHVLALRHHLRSIGIHATAHPEKSSDSNNTILPSSAIVEKMQRQLEGISASFKELPSVDDDKAVLAELRSLKFEIDASYPLLKRVQHLAVFAAAVEACDESLSDLLEHLDTFPSLPSETSSPFIPDQGSTPMQQLRARISFCADSMNRLRVAYAHVSDDERVKPEKTRLEQTWAELSEMGREKTVEVPPPSKSVLAPRHGPSTPSASRLPKPPAIQPRIRTRTMSTLSTTNSPAPAQRNTNGTSTPSRTASRLSTRSVSGPLTPASSTSTLYSATYSSRQRTMSNVSQPSLMVPLASSIRTRKLSNAPSRNAPSPTLSEISARTSQRVAHLPRTPLASSSRSGPSLRPPRYTPNGTRKSYVANPKNRLDVAVGHVMNKLPSNVHIEAVPDAWTDESGKYWIGDTDPKLCFCRILRSHTVMVRVGGGWLELSKFIRAHFGHSFLLPNQYSPPGKLPPSSQERWISSATLLAESAVEEEPENAAFRPSTPIRITALKPAFSPSKSNPSIPVTPISGWSPPPIPHSSSASPLAPLQFMRRVSVEPPSPGQSLANAHPTARPPSHASSHLRPPRTSLSSSSQSSSKPPVWRY